MASNLNEYTRDIINLLVREGLTIAYIDDQLYNITDIEKPSKNTDYFYMIEGQNITKIVSGYIDKGGLNDRSKLNSIIQAIDNSYKVNIEFSNHYSCIIFKPND